MSEKAIHEICSETGLSRSTLAHAAKQGLLKNAARQSGTIWIIDSEHADFQQWLEEHKNQPRVKGQVRHL